MLAGNFILPEKRKRPGIILIILKMAAVPGRDLTAQETMHMIFTASFKRIVMDYTLTALSIN